MTDCEHEWRKASDEDKRKVLGDLLDFNCVSEVYVSDAVYCPKCNKLGDGAPRGPGLTYKTFNELQTALDRTAFVVATNMNMGYLADLKRFDSDGLDVIGKAIQESIDRYKEKFPDHPVPTNWIRELEEFERMKEARDDKNRRIP